MTATLTIRLDDTLQSQLDRACSAAGRTRSDLARDALRRQLALSTFESIRADTLPFASAAGFLSDEDVFEAIS